MTRQRKIHISKAVVLIAAVPILLWAHVYGPDPGYSGVPTDNGGATCATVGCHTGKANTTTGGISINFPNGLTYTPGVTQTLSVTITDAKEKAAGFQLTARLASSSSTMAGTFATVDTYTQVICSAANLQSFTYLNKDGQSCTAKQPLQFIEHTGTQEVYSQGSGGFENSVLHGLPYTYNFTWTPPSSNVGAITLYVAGNAGVGFPATADGDHIYSTRYTLTPAGAAPSIASGGIITASDFGALPAATEGSWIEIYGSNLGPSAPYLWEGSDFQGNNAPTSLQGVSVTVNNIPAYVSFVSSGQVNVQVPSGAGTGPATVLLTYNGQPGAPYTLTLNPIEPALLAKTSFNIGGKQYVTAFHSDGKTLVAPSSAPQLGTPAKPGETLVIYGVGFGPAAPQGGSVIPPGVLVSVDNSLTNPIQFTIGGASALVQYDGLVQTFTGLYQFNVVVPQSLSNSDAVPLTFHLAGTDGTQTLYTAVHN